MASLLADRRGAFFLPTLVLFPPLVQIPVYIYRCGSAPSSKPCPHLLILIIFPDPTSVINPWPFLARFWYTYQ